MQNPILTSREIRTQYIKNFGCSLPLIFTFIENELYVMAKSIVRGAIEKDYKHGKDPYIDRIEKQFSNYIRHFEINDKEIILKVWERGGFFPSIIFVEVQKLLLRFNEVFPELSETHTIELVEQINSAINKLK